MLLAIDIGNTNVNLGIFRSLKESAKTPRTHLSFSKDSAGSALVASWRLASVPSATADEYGTKILDLLHYSTIERAEIKAIALASVVPALNSVFEELSHKYFKIKSYVIGENLKVPMTVLYDHPKEVGADRLVNSVAAFTRFGGPCIIVDFGTATTFDCVSKKGEYCGGIIVPGPVLSAESLALHTAKLPRVEMAKPQKLIGKNTVESIQSGLFYGYLCLVDGLVERLKSELGSGSKVIATGGLASLICAETKQIKKESVVPDLTLEGIRIVFEKNQ